MERATVPFTVYDNPAQERAALVETMLKDMAAAVEHFYGPDGLGKVVDQMKRINRDREDRAEMDVLEEMFHGVAP